MIPKNMPKILNNMLLPPVLDSNTIKSFSIVYYKDRFGNIVYQLRDKRSLKTKYIIIEKP